MIVVPVGGYKALETVNVYRARQDVGYEKHYDYPQDGVSISSKEVGKNFAEIVTRLDIEIDDVDQKYGRLTDYLMGDSHVS